MALVPYTGKRGVNQTFDTGDRTFGVSNSDALYDYYADNEAIVHTDGLVLTLLRYIGNKLFGAGVQFMRGTQLLKPPPDFDPDSLVPFLFETLPFIVAHGALVFYIYEHPDSSQMTPHVPEWSLITVRDIYDEKTRQPAFTAEWRDARRTEKLYVFNTGNPFGRKPTQTAAPIDAVKDMLRQYYYNLEMHMVAKDGNSRPPIVLQTQATTRDTAALANDLGAYDSEFERRMLQNIHTFGMDDLYLERIRRAADPERRTYGRPGQAVGPMPWWMRARDRMSAPPESRFVYIPHGLEYKNGQQNFVDGNFSKDQMEIVQAIYNAFGIPYSAILTTSSLQSTTGIELHKTMLVDTLRIWNRLYSTILTDVYRLIYDVNGVPVTMETGDGAAPKGKTAKVFTTVHLRNAFVSTPERVHELYHTGVISWETFQDMSLESLNLPTSLADRTVPPALRVRAQTEAQVTRLNMPAPKPGAPAAKTN